jgi:hypothetical protein
MSRIVLRDTSAPRHAKMPVEPRIGTGGGAAKIGREMREALSRMLSDAMLSAADAVEAVCPIQTGHLLSNFVLSTGSPYSGIDGSREAVSYSAQDAGRERVLKYDVGRDGRIYLSNNVDYLKHQRPFVTEAMMTAVETAPRGKRGRVRKMLKAAARAALKRGA